HEINGKALVGLTQGALLRLGITKAEHRDALCRQILKLRLKADIMEMKEIQMRH
ncbi:Sterile alpha motif domain, partial [Trinorchestia longiramus]